MACSTSGQGESNNLSAVIGYLSGQDLARSGLSAMSREENSPESHIIHVNPLLTKLVPLRLLHIGLVLFLHVYGP